MSLEAGIVAAMTFRKIGTGLCLLLPALAWTACSSDSDTTNAGGAGGAANKAGAAAGGHAGTETSGEAGVANGGSEAGSTSEAGTTSEAGSTSEGGEGGEGPAVPAEPLDADIDTVVVIYAENRSFDGLYGNFPGAEGLSTVIDAQGNTTAKYVAQKDRDGVTVLGALPKTWTGATAQGNTTVVPEILTGSLPNQPFGIENAFVAAGGSRLTTGDVTRDLTHRFFENIMEINGGTNDMFAAWLDAGGLTMGHFDYSNSAMYKLAKDNVLADNFFEGAFGGSFLNHQYLICACAPAVPASHVTTGALNVLGPANSKGVPQLQTTSGPAEPNGTPASALDGQPYFKSSYIAPLDYFGDGDGYRAVNTMQPAYQPSANVPAVGGDPRYADPTQPNTLVPQTQTTIGDQLTAKGVTWAWYATAWNLATADGEQDPSLPRTAIYAPEIAKSSPDFQPHHHPFNFYAAFDPATHADARTEHLRDYNQLLTDITAGTVPHVAYYKPQGNFNQHPGYASLDDGDTHIANLVSKLKAGPQWAHMVIVITYDEYGGQWDHVAPPKGDKIGPGTRIPALIISPYGKAGTVDHTQYDTASITRLIARRFGTPPLAGIASRDAALVAGGGTKMGDLTNALTLP